MRSKQSFPRAKTAFAVCIAFFLALTVATQPAQATTKFKVLHTFHGANGAQPFGAVIRDAVGNLYGTTNVGGVDNCGGGVGCGTVFKLNGTGKQVWLQKFNGRNGSILGGALLRDPSGNVFGTAGEGGDLSCFPPYGCGVVFKVDRAGRRVTVLHKFTDTPDGDSPYGPVVQDEAGNLYGVTVYGGADTQGTVFKIDTANKETILYSFAGPPEGGGDGAFPVAGVARDTTGNLYGVTFAGGAYGAGAVYGVDSSGNEALLYSFTGGSDGAQPSSTLLLDSQGNLYGTTQNGGNGQCGGTGCGVVFELSPQSGGGWKETVLYDFCSATGCSDGERPQDGPLAMNAAGNLYGTTYFGGRHRNCNGDGCGVVFKLEPAGKETVLHSFTGGKDGALPRAGLTIDGAGRLYGTTEEGGDLKCLPKYGGCGVVFRIVP